MKFTHNQIKQLAREGKIRSYKAPGFSSSYKMVVVPREKPKGIAWLETNLAYWCNSRCVTLEQEYRFDPERRWRADFAIPAFMALIEYEGIFGAGMSRHTTHKGYNGDLEKYNRATALGWRIIRVSASNYTTAIKTLNDLLNK
jgi:hypothetical protein